MRNRKSYQSITIYKDMAPQILELEKVEAGEILQAIMRYSCYGEDTDMSQYDRFVRSLWKTIKLKLDAGEAHDKEISETNSNNAKKRWEKEKGNTTGYDCIQSDTIGCDRTTITDTVTGTNSFTATISSTVTKTDTEHADAVFDSADRPAAAAAAENAAPQTDDLFSVKQLLATVKKNKVNLTEEGVRVFHEEMQEAGWILYQKPIEKKGITRALRAWAKYHPEYSLVSPKSAIEIEKEIYEIADYYISQELYDASNEELNILISRYCPQESFTKEQLEYMADEWCILPKAEKSTEIDENSEFYKNWDP